jgi:phage-related holin
MEVWMKALIASMIAVFAPIYTVMFATGFLIVFDLITGMMAANKRKEHISSAVFRRTVTKIAVYQIVIMSAFLVEKYMLGGALPISKVAASIVGITELMSIMENAEVVYGQPIFNKIRKMLGSENDKKK